MKRLARSYTSFTRPERNGLIGLCLLLAAVITVRTITKEHENEVSHPEQVIAAYRQQEEASINKQQPKTSLSSEGNLSVQSAKSVKSEVQTSFDPNTADSITLRSFKLQPNTIANLMKWRAKGKRFYRKEDLKPLYTLTTEQYNMLAQHIVIKPLRIDINHADSLTLLKLRGIGPKLAHKIIERRSAVGPFTSYEELKELHHFRDGVFENLVKDLKPLKAEPLIRND